MSEENEHTAKETEAETNEVYQNKEQSKSESSMLNNETEQPMLEDEEMPTYISVSTPSKRDDSDVNNTKQKDKVTTEEEHNPSPYRSDDQDGGSIYVLSSGEESNHPYNYEGEEDYADSEGLDNEYGNVMLEDEEQEEEDEDEDVIHGNPLGMQSDDDEDDEDIDGEFEEECFDRASDDFVLNNRLQQHHKERSLSLQDLSFTKHNVRSPYNRKRLSLNIFGHNYLGTQQSAMIYPLPEKKQIVPFKYQHVESKVKQYIRDIKEQNRKSLEKRVKEQELVTNRNHKETESNDMEKPKAKTTTKNIKDYAEKAIKDLQQEENEDCNLMYNMPYIMENGENDKSPKKMSESQYKHIRKDADLQNERYTQNCDDKPEKRNGSVNTKSHHVESQETLTRNIKLSNANQPTLVNGHQQTPTLLNLRTLSYEEFLHGPVGDEKKENLAGPKSTKMDETETYHEEEMIDAQDVDNGDASCPLKIEKVESVRTSQGDSESVNFAKTKSADKMNAMNNEIIHLKAQLGQKDAQFYNLRDAYQKTLVENIKMKQELEALKKSLAMYQNESKTCETKMAAVQTENVTESAANENAAPSEEVNNKISTSSIASTASSIDHWADSAYSPAISIKPPDLTPILNSDDSIVLTNGITPRKLPHPSSRTFITSSRILQTLSSITQGKSRVESPLVRSAKKRLNENSTDQLLNLNGNSPIQASSSKKRKATDMHGASVFLQPFKIPHTTVEMETKDTVDAAETESKYSQENINSKSEKEGDTSVHKSLNGSTLDESKMEETDERDDNVKCFIYNDEDDSKHRSFLIQAEEPSKDRMDNEKNRIQECGPYLLGNLEVRMSEINGTISIWGKEINQESTSENEDGIDVPGIRSTEKKSCHGWQNTSQSRFNGSPLVCSTNKKQKVPLKFNRSNLSQCCQSLSLNSTKTSFLDDGNKSRMSNPFSPNVSIRSCDNSDSSKYRKEWSTCKGASTSQQKLHSCCTHYMETIERECNCGDTRQERERYDGSPKCCKNHFYSKDTHRGSCRNISDSRCRSQDNVVDDVICKHRTNVTCRRIVGNTADNGTHSKCCSRVKDVSCTCKSSSDNLHLFTDNSDKHTCKNLSNDGEEDPLIPHKRSSETLEGRQRRLSGKRVRGILMDLLRGCGDCRNNSDSGLTKNVMQPKGSHSATKCSPQIKISPAPSPEPTFSSSTQCNERCCHAYARRIESLLEEFRMEIGRVRSRSDAILDMLNMLHSVDMN